MSSPLWEHFEKDSDFTSKLAKCNYCHNNFSYKTTITNLKYHLKLQHPLAFEAVEASKKVKKVYNISDNSEQSFSGHFRPSVTKTDDTKQSSGHFRPSMNITDDTEQSSGHFRPSVNITNNKEQRKRRKRNTNNSIWDHFTRDEDTKTAECHYCKKYLSYKTTTTNLQQHLRGRHRSAFKQLRAIMEQRKKPAEEDAWSKKNRNNRSIWEYFDKDPTTKTAECHKCLKNISYQTCSSNLRVHLKRKHIDSYNELKSPVGGEAESDTTDCDSSLPSEQSAEDAEELMKLSDVWGFFEEDSGRRAHCVVCRATVGNDYEELKAHLKDSHPKLLLQIMQNSDRNSDAGSNNADDDDNTFTEVVYLEQDPVEEEPKPREKPKVTPKIIHKVAKKRERLNSSDDLPLKRKKDDDDNDELATFIKYITCLLKKLPQDVFTQVQVDIINTILRASTNASSSHTATADILSPAESSRVILNKDLSKFDIPNIVTVKEITPSDSALLGHNYTIVASKEVVIEDNK